MYSHSQSHTTTTIFGSSNTYTSKIILKNNRSIAVEVALLSYNFSCFNFKLDAGAFLIFFRIFHPV